MSQKCSSIVLGTFHHSMLSRRVFQQLTDSLLLGSAFKLVCVCWVSPQGVRSSRRSAPQFLQSRNGSSSSTRWKSRQGRDAFAKEAKVQGLKSRAAFKLLEINEKHKLFKPGQTVVDLGYAPGSWSQVAANRTSPNGRVIGIDIIPAQPPRGVSTIQGNFLSPDVQAEVRAYVQDPTLGRPRKQTIVSSTAEDEDVTEDELEEMERGYIDLERRTHLDVGKEQSVPEVGGNGRPEEEHERRMSKRQRDKTLGRVVDVVLSDMSAPWDQTSGYHRKSVSDPYFRMMNTSGMAFRDHAGSMDLCMAALKFCFDTLRTGGHFVCKFYQGSEEKELEKKLKRLFQKVHREKPESSRSESKEAYFVALRRNEGPSKEEVFKE
ncbi:FtsJ-domain-containing protein [Lepidopterella palustris CBS 459.81]|uniref:rRNA methyltransferase 2, mitochondrial n=1 Tax=Lepidopterella palustris CBS 459.81 TaxID=1314670 RepID=A0A8E2EIE4_9PEZI|nr:FtsJ-domain-containing protein [Lepidopterella palustris CBS 459.81]